MPFADLTPAHGQAVRLHHEFTPATGLPDEAPPLVLCNSLGTTLNMWDAQMPAFTARRRVLRYDVRGHGQSSRPEGGYTIAQLGQDLLALMDHVGIAQADFCGLSMGGMTGMWLGVHAPQRIRKLVLCNTSAKLGPPELWDQRLAVLREQGMAGLIPGILGRWLTERYRSNNPAGLAQVVAMLEGTTPEGYAANVMAIREMDQLDDLARITCPTLVISGTHDGSTPPAMGQAIAQRIRGSRVVELDAAHLSNVEQPEAFNAAVLGFLDGEPAGGR